MFSKPQIVGGTFLGAAVLSTNAFVLPGSPAAQVSEPSALRGATQTFAETNPSNLHASAGAAAVAASVAALGSFAEASKRRAVGRKHIARSAAAEAAPEEPPPPPKWELATSLGAMPPLGCFDPLGFSKDEEAFKDLRAKELKHGRLAMMGAVGLLIQSAVQVPGMEGVPKNIYAITQGNGLIGGVAILAIIGVLEAVVFVQDPKKEPGNFGNPVPLIGDDYSEEMRLKELNNGRMAMGSFLLVAVTSLTTGKDALQQFGVGVAETATTAATATAAELVAVLSSPSSPNWQRSSHWQHSYCPLLPQCKTRQIQD